jgi:hypothetical protein
LLWCCNNARNRANSASDAARCARLRGVRCRLRGLLPGTVSASDLDTDLIKIF